MTICLGWRDNNAVYLAADSAVTKKSHHPIDHRGQAYTTFGELQHYEEKVSVEETSLKILRHGNTAAVFAGDARRAEDVFSVFTALSNSLSVRAAFDAAWTSFHAPANPSVIQALFGYYEEDGPHLLKFQSSAQTQGAEVNFACIGNVDADGIGFFESVTMSIPVDAEGSANKLVCLVSFLQWLGIHSNLMASHGIGGYVAGCFIDCRGLAWAPDTLHTIMREGFVDQLSNNILSVIVTCARFDAFFVWNNLMSGFHGFTNRFGENLGRTRSDVVENILTHNRNLPRIRTEQFKTDYIVFHDLRGITTVACVRDDKPRHVRYAIERQNDGSLAIRYYLSEQATALLSRSVEDGVFAFIE
jgi:hypothetical protein